MTYKSLLRKGFVLALVAAVAVLFGILRASPAPAPAPQQQYGEDTATCLPDCFNSHWTTPKVIRITIPDFGEFWVKYRQRYACGVWYDVYIDWIIPVDTGPNDPFAGYPMQYILEIVTEGLLIDNPMQFPPLAGSGAPCHTNWRVIKGNCWGRVIIPDDVCRHQYLPCGSVQCCLEAYSVCLDVDGNRTVTKVSGWNEYSCAGMTTPPGSDSCEPACGFPPQYGPN